MPIREKINLIYNQFGNTKDWKKLFKLKFDTRVHLDKADDAGPTFKNYHTSSRQSPSIEKNVALKEYSMFSSEYTSNDNIKVDEATDGTFLTNVNVSKKSKFKKRKKRKGKKANLQLKQKPQYESSFRPNGHEKYQNSYILGTSSSHIGSNPGMSPRSDSGKKVFDKSVDLQDGKLFFSKQNLQLVDRTLLTKPVIDTLYQVAVNEGLENAHFNMMDYLKMVKSWEKDNVSNDPVAEGSKPNLKMLKTVFNLLKTNNVKKIERLLERNTNPECRKELIRHRFLGKNSEIDSKWKKGKQLKNHLRSESKSDISKKSTTYKNLIRNSKRDMYKHQVNISMKAIALNEYRDIEMLKQIPHFNSLYK